MQPIILAAGMGTRMRPITQLLPKELLPIGNIPALFFIFNEVYNYDKIYMVTSINKPLLCDLSSIYNIKNIEYVFQDKPLGTGHAVYSCKNYINSNKPIYLVLPDMLIFNKCSMNVFNTTVLYDIYNKLKKNIIVLMKVKPEDAHNYGMVQVEPIYGENTNLVRIINIIEKPNIYEKYDNLAIMGRYLLEYDIFEKIEKYIPNNDNKKEIHLTDALYDICNEDILLGYILEDDYIVCDIGNQKGYIDTISLYGNMSDEFKNNILKIIDN